MVAMNYPLWDVFVSTLYLMLFIYWIILVFHILYDIMRSNDLKGWQKAAWVVFLLILPLLGALIYLVARGDIMQGHDIKAATQQQKAFEDYIRRVANSPSDAPKESQGS